MWRMFAQMGVRERENEKRLRKRSAFSIRKHIPQTHDLHNLIATGDAQLGAGVQVSKWIGVTDKGQWRSREEGK